MYKVLTRCSYVFTKGSLPPHQLLPTSCPDHFFLVARAFKIYSLSNIQAYDSVSLAKVVMLHITSWLVHLIPGNVCFLTSISKFPGV